MPVGTAAAVQQAPRDSKVSDAQLVALGESIGKLQQAWIDEGLGSKLVDEAGGEQPSGGKPATTRSQSAAASLNEA